jgi:hypothetical protein
MESMTIKVFYDKVGEVDPTGLDNELRVALIPFDGVAWLDTISKVRVDYQDSATTEQMAQGSSIVAAHISHLAAQLLVSRNANAAATAIPLWAHYREDEAQAWWETNIHGPLVTGRANLPVTLTLASTRVVIVALLDILDKMAAMMLAMARLIIVLRNNAWPGLQNPPA